jgi:hypothetical protein
MGAKRERNDKREITADEMEPGISFFRSDIFLKRFNRASIKPCRAISILFSPQSRRHKSLSVSLKLSALRYRNFASSLVGRVARVHRLKIPASPRGRIYNKR